MLKSYKGVPLVGIPTVDIRTPSGEVCHYCSFYHQWEESKCPGVSSEHRITQVGHPCYRVVLVREIDVLTARVTGEYVDFSKLPDVWQANKRGA